MSRELIRIGSTKTYTHSVGLSCAFRQWRANSHCRFIHGYALQVTLDFCTLVPDENGWTVDFGGLKEVKQWLEKNFDHKLVVAESDPYMEQLVKLNDLGIAQIHVIPEVGCENFARYIMKYVDKWLKNYKGATLNGIQHVKLRKVTIAEHGGNSAYVERDV